VTIIRKLIHNNKSIYLEMSVIVSSQHDAYTPFTFLQLLKTEHMVFLHSTSKFSTQTLKRQPAGSIFQRITFQTLEILVCDSHGE